MMELLRDVCSLGIRPAGSNDNFSAAFFRKNSYLDSYLTIVIEQSFTLHALHIIMKSTKNRLKTDLYYLLEGWNKYSNNLPSKGTDNNSPLQVRFLCLKSYLSKSTLALLPKYTSETCSAVKM